MELSNTHQSLHLCSEIYIFRRYFSQFVLKSQPCGLTSKGDSVHDAAKGRSTFETHMMLVLW